MKLGIIGIGNMGTAILRGYLTAGAAPESVMALGHHPERMQALKAELGIQTADAMKELVDFSDIIIFAVKPKDLEGVLAEAAPLLQEEQLLVSIAAGKSIADISKMLDRGNGLAAIWSGQHRIIRVMPNTPALVGEGMSGLCRNEAVTDEEFAAVSAIFESIGKAEEVPESLMDAVGAVSGCSPAYVYLLIEAMADGAVCAGMPRAKAYTFAAQSVLGAAKMVLETGEHPGALKDAVCSPGGTTIEAVRTLERGGFRGTVMDAVMAAAEKSSKM